MDKKWAKKSIVYFCLSVAYFKAGKTLSQNDIKVRRVRAGVESPITTQGQFSKICGCIAAKEKKKSCGKRKIYTSNVADSLSQIFNFQKWKPF